MQNNDERFFIGDHLELEIRRVNKSYEGWYRCLSKAENGQNQMNISQIYHIQVLQNRNISMVSEFYIGIKMPNFSIV
jgi:hypothetical protein